MANTEHTGELFPPALQPLAQPGARGWYRTPDCWPKIWICLTTILCAAQLFWFGSRAIHQIDFDGMAYVASAREVREGRFTDSLNAFRSPLMSWTIAAIPRLNAVQAGKVATVGTFLSTVVLLYIFAFQLWNSSVIASVACLLFVVARGLSFVAVAFVTPDFLLASLVLAYFIVLLRSLRKAQQGWWKLGGVHGIAFLAKAIALPWLGVCTLVAALISGATWKGRLSRLVSAALIPIMIAGSWGMILRGKYGHFTTGSQFKVNLLQWTLRGVAPKPSEPYKVLTNMAERTNEDMNYDPMPPLSWAWSYRPPVSILVPRVISAEFRNVPLALKEVLIICTPGIILALLLTYVWLFKFARNRPEWIVGIVVAVGAVSLVGAYSALVIDARYFFPLLPLLLAIAVKSIFPDPLWHSAFLRKVAVGGVVIGFIFAATYHASPFRVQTRDWQIACYRAGDSLRRHGAGTAVSIGSGPFPEHGIGWEAGYTSSFFGHVKLVAASDKIPADLSALEQDLRIAAPDAVLTWSTEASTRARMERVLVMQYPVVDPIIDPQLGEVGIVLYRVNR